MTAATAMKRQKTLAIKLFSYDAILRCKFTDGQKSQ